MPARAKVLGNKFLGNIRECDAIIHVIRCFDDDNIVREGGAKVDPLEDKSVIDTELQLKDLETIESQLTKQKKTAAAGNKDAKTMVTVLELTRPNWSRERTLVALLRKQGRAEGGSRPLPPHYQACALRGQC